MRVKGWKQRVVAGGVAVVAVLVVGCSGASVTGPSELPEAYQEDEAGPANADEGGVSTQGIETSPIVPPRFPPPHVGK